MAGNTFGTLFRITTFGESHGPLIGVVIDGCYSGIQLDLEFIRTQLSRRKPGQSAITTQRMEDDEPEVVSGLINGITTGAPLTLFIRNKDQRSSDYDTLKNTYRPSHADYTYEQKYGIRDHRGSGRASARETAARVAAGAVAMQILKSENISVDAYVSRIGNISIPENISIDTSKTYHNILRCPHEATAQLILNRIEEAAQSGDTLGGIISCIINGIPAGLGEPVFDKFHAQLGKAMLSINAVKGFEIGSGFFGTSQMGSQQNDVFDTDKNGKVFTTTNNSGGVQGGITNGMDITFNVAFKPVSTLMKPQQSINAQNQKVIIQPGGRHDVCVVPRATPIVEAMAAITTLDFLMIANAAKHK
ncbi:MAG TPA: chorismate synthase [Bacteroidia bacterium]|jgi:chorismate synthase|nr:chorismate synthase [Bacteroidia bacterium]HMU18484.1 chorismate synthase [Bacteroidia bacterium]